MKASIQFSEDFAGGSDAGWRWIRENPEAWKIEGGALHLRTLPGTLWGDSNNAQNILVRTAGELQDGFGSRVRVTNQPALGGEQGGLIWYHDDGNYIKLVKECLDDSEWIVLAREEDDDPMLINKVPINASSAELQLVFVNGFVQGRFRSSEPDEWSTVGECSLVKEVDLYVGVFAHGGTLDAERWTQLGAFRIIT